MEGLLLATLGAAPRCHHINELEKTLKIQELIFDEFEDDDFSGFYDWLRNKSGKIIGIRYTRHCPFEPVLINTLQKLRYVNFAHPEIIEIYFYDDHTYQDDISNDQDFGICKIYISSNGILAMLLDILYLSNEEFSSILLA